MGTTAYALSEPIRLVASNSLWIAGIQSLFGDPCGVEIVAVSLAAALAANCREIVLVDSSSTGVAGFVRKILDRFRQSCPEVRLIVIGHDTDADRGDAYIEGLILAGAKGFLSSSSTAEEFKTALENVRDGSIWAPRQVLSRMLHSSRLLHGSHPAESTFNQRLTTRASTSVSFTPREDQVIRLLVGGQCNREIGTSLGIDPVTVKAHLGRIMRKAGVCNRIELTMFALDRRRYQPPKLVRSQNGPSKVFTRGRETSKPSLASLGSLLIKV